MENSKLSSRFSKRDIKTKKTLSFRSVVKTAEAPEISEIPDNAIEEDFKKALLEKIDTTPVWFEYSKNRQKELIKNFVDTKISSENIQFSGIDKNILIDNLTDSLANFGAVQNLLDNEKVNSVVINGTKSIYIEIDGKILNTETKLSEKQLKFLINSISSMSGIESFIGIKNFAIKHYTLTVVGDDICTSGLNITIKKQKTFDRDYLIKSGMVTKEIFDFLVSAINLKKNIVISGGINSGKTVLLDVLTSSALKGKRTFIIENNPVISADFDTIVKFRNNENVISHIVKSSPDYLVSDLNYIEPEFTDIKGIISTVRANSTQTAFQALVGMCIVGGLPEKYARIKALKNFDYIVHLEKSEDGICRVVSVLELTAAKTLQASIKQVFKV